VAVYRVILVFSAANGPEAKAKAEAALKGAGQGAKIDRLTERRETWGAVSEK
jgi:hypothetical protein